jgi:FtsH-binding integral membrane protein
MFRRLLGRLDLLVAALLVGVGGFLPWLHGHSVAHIPLRDLVHGINGHQTTLAQSMADVLVGCALVALLAAFFGSRILAALAGVVGLALVVAWFVLEEHALSPHRLGATQLQTGFWVTAAGVLLAIFGAVMLRRRFSSLT